MPGRGASPTLPPCSTLAAPPVPHTCSGPAPAPNLGLTVDLNLVMLGRSHLALSGWWGGRKGLGGSAQPRELAAPHTARMELAEPASPLVLLPKLRAPCWEAKQPVLGGFPRAHVKLELRGGSKLSLSHRHEWWQLLWLASDGGRCPNGWQSLMLAARAWQDHVLGGHGLRRGTHTAMALKRERREVKTTEETKEKGKEKEGRREKNKRWSSK